MAFTIENLLNKTGMPPGKADYIYLSDTDTRATISASGYFNNDDDDQNFAADDLIHVRGDQGIYTIRVDAVSSGTVTTAGIIGSTLIEVVTAANVITAAETGTRYFLNNATGFQTTLPAIALGLEFWFFMGATALSSGNHTVISTPVAIIEGSIASPEAAAVVCVAAADSINFINALAVPGDYAHVWCDGTTWYLDGMCFVQDGMTTTT